MTTPTPHTNRITAIGLMTGTSLDGIDYALVEINDQAINVLDVAFAPYPIDLQNRLRQLRDTSLLQAGTIPLELSYELSQDIARRCADLIDAQMHATIAQNLLIDAIGYQGQTIHHHPQKNVPYSFQLIDAELLNQLTAIPVVSNFRQSDIANGGEGAPLTPVFHQQFLSSPTEARAVINLGGIANASLLPPIGNAHPNSDSRNANTAPNTEQPIAFDCGPGNTLLDEWCRTQFGAPFDKGGTLAQAGNIAPSLLEELIADRYFYQAPPKSTGQEYFNLNWLNKKMGNYQNCTRQDILATLTELTAHTTINACTTHMPDLQQIILCGGGAKNDYLINRMKEHTDIPITISNEYGIDSDYLEAIAFAYFAGCRLTNTPLNFHFATGSRGAIIHGTVCDAYNASYGGYINADDNADGGGDGDGDAGRDGVSGSDAVGDTGGSTDGGSGENGGGNAN